MTRARPPHLSGARGLPAVSLVVITAIFSCLASAGTFTAYGPENFTRATAEPAEMTRSFSIRNPNTTYTLRVANGGFKGEFEKRVSSAVIVLNGSTVVGPKEFNQNVALIERPVALLANNRLVVQLESAPGSGIGIQIIGVDNDPPVITATASPAPNAAGWNNSNVTVTFTCSDATSAIAVCPAPVILATDGAKQVISGTARDQAGHTASASVTVNLDKTPPAITAGASPPPNAAGWNNSNVTVTFACTDALSSVEFCQPPAIVSNEGGNQVVSGTARDRAGNTATASVTVNLDKTAPSVAIASPPNGTAVSGASATVSGTVADLLSGVSAVNCNATPGSLTSGNFSCGLTLALGTNMIAALARDIAGNSATANLTLIYAPAPWVTITSPANLSFLNISPVTVNGTVSDPGATVTVNGIAAPNSGGAFSVAVPLAEGNNTLTASARSAAGHVGTASIQVTLDTTPPRVTIVSPPNGFVTGDSSITVSGNVNDIVVGTVNEQQVQVTVNGIAAQVANRSFSASSVPLALGDNQIQAVGRDRAGNFFNASITVRRQNITQPQIRIISGNNQTGPAGAALAAALVVALTDAAGNPVSGKSVIFKVLQNSGTLSNGGAPGRSLAVVTNAQGQAQARWTLGNRSGAASDIVEAYGIGFEGTALFSATALSGAPAKINVDAGNSQTGVVSQPLAHPFVAAVTDAGHNRLGNVPVTFTVKQGGGSFNGPASITVNTDPDGRALAVLTVGFQEGIANNLVEANFAGNTGFPASFTASAKAALDPAATRITSVVLDNSNIPIPGVTIRAVQSELLTQNSSIIANAITARTDAQGQFTIQPAPVGFVKLLVDGSTAQRVGSYPSLDYDLVTIAGQTNTIGMPIYLLPLNTQNQLCATDTTGGGTLTVPEAPGFSLTFGPGQVTFPGGSKTGCIHVTVVHPDKVPMVPGFGQQPRFIVTIQPAGALFNPPAPITIPNVDGLKPGHVTEMYSFDHDIGSFVAIGTGTVSEDGLVIRSNPGVGVLKAGWHCGGDPTLRGTVADCPECQWCQGTPQSATCVEDPIQKDRKCTGTDDGDLCTENRCPNGNCASVQKSLLDRRDVNFSIDLRMGLEGRIAPLRENCPKPVDRTGHMPTFDGCGSGFFNFLIPDCLSDLNALLNALPAGRIRDLFGRICLPGSYGGMRSVGG